MIPSLSAADAVLMVRLQQHTVTQNGKQIRCALTEQAATRIEELAREVGRLRWALQGLHDDNIDYLTRNNLGGYDNHWMKAARAALTPPAAPARTDERGER